MRKGVCVYVCVCEEHVRMCRLSARSVVFVFMVEAVNDESLKTHRG